MNPNAYKRPNKPKKLHVSRRDDKPAPVLQVPQVVAVHASTECHVTPAHIAARMVDYLGAAPDMLTLEPSAGTGNLVAALIDSGHYKSQIITVELNQELSAQLGKRFDYQIARHGSDFEQYNGIEFDRVIMNPPFKRVKQHIKHALSMLKNGGVLIALVPITYEHPQAVTLEALGNDTFSAARVNTKIIRLKK